MKTNGAPEKIYLTTDGNNSFVFTQKRSDNEGIVYTRTDVFIEKVINFLNYKLDDAVATRTPGTIIPNHIIKQELIDDLKNYMKGE